ncbi:MAG: ABC transporter permease subunit, partial [Gaiellaceae bacterium]
MSTLQTLVDAVALGTLYALVAMGIALIFGVMRLVNFAHGELLTAGAYALFLTNDLP